MDSKELELIKMHVEAIESDIAPFTRHGKVHLNIADGKVVYVTFEVVKKVTNRASVQIRGE